MLIETADKSGFCFGVQRAIDLTGQAADKYGEVFTLGPLIHNTIVTDSLEKRGVHIAADVQEAQGKPLVIRSHGVGRDTEERAQAVCPALPGGSLSSPVCGSLTKASPCGISAGCAAVRGDRGKSGFDCGLRKGCDTA